MLQLNIMEYGMHVELQKINKILYFCRKLLSLHRYE